ncbi:hypothetical protein PQC43_gp108 [Escherichia phage vB_EcoP-101114UKE3]|uniref:Uncharacterized protein n=1 Tax=Escherichia phage vB_EcoP-101114UKE3 TaxID=2865794 RepID=A0AAE7XS56_9CAUD|nr:hypothetical protein PQC43_gp108 [Escherichia phage vB_EcoP-101114UKE3]QZI79276.1 hypothetical protein 101114UKE3_145 [Escherichia phage vB_EcoP-101114UKE3]USM81249.1 hypothetical protein 101114BS3_122 [Escherichia phage vB_EcoP-101114BS3]
MFTLVIIFILSFILFFFQRFFFLLMSRNLTGNLLPHGLTCYL